MTNATSSSIGIIGAGAWGTAIAQSLAQAGRAVSIWGNEPEIIAALHTQHKHPRAFPETQLNPGISATSDLNDLKNCSIFVLVIPAQSIRGFCPSLQQFSPRPIVLAAKGIEENSGKLLSAVVAETLPGWPVAALTGPNFASEVVRGLPAASTIACPDPDILAALQKNLSTPTLRLYPTTDLIGAQVGGAVKNVLAIACGVVEGLNLGDNARAAIITRGLAEMARLTAALGGQRETLMGLSGMGDLILTCTSRQSRNYRYGLALAGVEDARLPEGATVEGVHTAQAVLPLAAQLKVDMPICATLAACLRGETDVRAAASELLQRPPRAHEQE